MSNASKPHAGKVAVITGASRGLGAGMAEQFAAEGMRLGLCARNEPIAPEDCADSDVVLAAVDVRDAAAVANFAEQVGAQLGPIDLWINNAGVLDPIAPMRDVEPGQFAEHLAINVLGVFHGSRAFVHHLRAAARGGALINVSSGAARSPYEGWSAYCAAKAAVDRFTEVIAREEAAAGLRAWAVAPGVIDTDMQAQIRSRSAEEFPLVERFREMKQQNAFSTPAQVAKGMLELAFGDAGSGPGEVLVDLRG
ncbi:MAG: SDR family NAD(P)-dependent oxidoreductase [Acidobacteria bacterium]|nr:MAG: SDR family NAD(P)-dependent oxidoreductase [Acidobacteriota bacterium]REK05880.1 MAG: SDR family NAD(P)-dependent oxidoreductase [Acidobacteriota bacterium]